MSKSNNIPPSGNNHNNRKNVGSISYGSAAFPLGYDEKVMLKDALAKARKEKTAVSCFGGLLFYAREHSGRKLICHAVRTTDQEYIQAVSAWYHMTRDKREVPFLTYNGSYNLDNGTVVFTFDVIEEFISMRQLMERDNHSKYGEELFRKLVNFIQLFKTKAGKDFTPLRSIHLDTVFMDTRGNLHLLPLLCLPSQYPIGFPLEVGTPEADERTDLYTAALLALQVSSGCEYECPSEGKRMDPELVPEVVMRCLCVFASGRDDLKSVINILAEGGKEASESPDTGRKNIRRNAQGDVISEGRKNRQNREQADTHDADAPAEERPAFTGFSNIVKSFFSRITVFEPSEQTSGTAGQPDESAPRFYPTKGAAPVSRSDEDDDADSDSYDDVFYSDDNDDYSDDDYRDSDEDDTYGEYAADSRKNVSSNASRGYYDGHDAPSFGSDE